MNEDVTLLGGYSLHQIQAELATTAAVYPEVCNELAREKRDAGIRLYNRALELLQRGRMDMLVDRNAMVFTASLKRMTTDPPQWISIEIPTGLTLEGRGAVIGHLKRELLRRLEAGEIQ